MGSESVVNVTVSDVAVPPLPIASTAKLYAVEGRRPSTRMRPDDTSVVNGVPTLAPLPVQNTTRAESAFVTVCVAMAERTLFEFPATARLPMAGGVRGALV